MGQQAPYRTTIARIFRASERQCGTFTTAASTSYLRLSRFIFGRFDTRRVPQTYTNVVPSIGHEFQVRNGFSSVFSWTHTFAPTVLNEFRAGYVRGRNLYYPYSIGSDVIQ